MLSLAVFWQGIDLTSFGAMMYHWGLRAEVNPLAHWLATNLGGEEPAILALIGLKLLLLAYILFVSTKLAHRTRIRQTVLGVAILAGLIGGISNLLTI